MDDKKVLRGILPLCLISWATLAHGQIDQWQARPIPIEIGEVDEATQATATEPITAEEIKQKLASLDNTSLDEAEKARAAEFLQQALESLNALEDYVRRRGVHERNIDNYQANLDEIKEKLAKLSPAEAVDVAQELSALESQLATQEQLVQQKRERLAKAEAEPKNRSSWLAELPKLVGQTNEELNGLREQLQQVSSAESSDTVANSRRLAWTIREKMLDARLRYIEKRQQYFTMSPELKQLERDHASKDLALEEKRLAALREVINRRRLAEAEAQATTATREAAIQRPQAIAELAKRNAALAARQTEIVAKKSALEEKLAATANELETLKRDFERSCERIEDAGSTEASGQLLRQQQELLPNTRELRQQIAARNEESSEILYEKFGLQDQRSAIVDADLEERVQEILAQVAGNLRTGAEAEIRSLLESERKILNSLINNYSAYSADLAKLTLAQNDLAAKTEEFADFIAENVLWIRSCTAPKLADWQPMLGALAWSFNPTHWLDSGKMLVYSASDSPLTLTLFAVVFLGLIYVQRRNRKRLRAIGNDAAKRTTTDFALSLEAVLLTVELALPWPALLWFGGWWLDNPGVQSEFVRALSGSLKFTAVCLLLMVAVRQLCRPGGLADAHFGWPQSCLVQLRSTLRWQIWFSTPLILWLTGLELQDEQQLWSSTLGRLCFVVLMLLLLVACWRVLLSDGSPFRNLVIKNPATGRLPLQNFWCPLVVAAPVVLAVLATVGYYYSAQQLALRLLQLVSLVLVLLVAGGLTTRWILLNRRRLAREQAKQRRAQALAAAEVAAQEDAPLTPPVEIVEDSVDLAELGKQTNSLIRSVLLVIGMVFAWFICRDMLPALARIAESQVFPSTSEAPLNWGQLIRFLITVGVTYIAVGKLPAMLEFTVLQRLPLDSGSRYAISSISRYVLLAIGIYMGFTSLGFNTTSIQWLVAAMGVGLGFGLQEIFANFVSGIILLFERPIRLGDIITLGDKTGTVSRIRMRATTIIDWDRKEYVVPNKDLVTERLLNWTLSDATNRIVVEVGVAYGSDTDLACRLLMETAIEHPLTLEEPAPLTTFEGFGDSALNLTLRCYLPSLENRLQTIHELHTTIDKKFRQAGIEIAFPQTDLHVRTVPKEWLHRAETPAAAKGTPVLGAPDTFPNVPSAGMGTNPVT